MATEITRAANPLADMLDWFDASVPRAARGLGLAPQVRVEDYVEDGNYVIRAEMPGIDPDQDVEVTVQDGVLTISGERREEVKEKHRQELHYGSFRRRITLPEGADPTAVEASYTDGVLEVRVPCEAEQGSAVTVPVKRS